MFKLIDMKNIIIIATLVLCFTATVSAKNKNKTSIGINLSVKPIHYNFWSQSLWSNNYGYWSTENWRNYSVESFTESNNIPFIGIGLQHDLSNRMGIKYGYQFGYSESKIFKTFNEGDIDNLPKEEWIHYGHRSYISHSIGADFIFKYINNEKFELYCLVGLSSVFTQKRNKLNEGLTLERPFQTDLYKDFFFIPQFTPIAIKYGKKIAISAELGLGYKGYVNVGVSKKLN